MRCENGYYLWNKGEKEKLSDFFSTKEFECQCKHSDCIEQKASKVLIDKLTSLRSSCGFPMTITSGFRCAKHQKDLADGGAETAKGISSHELGNAADIRCNSLNSGELALKAEPFFSNIGIGRRFIHVDIRDGKRRWAYSY